MKSSDYTLWISVISIVDVYINIKSRNFSDEIATFLFVCY